MDRDPALPNGLRLLLVVAAAFVVVGGLRMAAGLLVPVAIAAFVAIASLPALQRLRRLRLPGPLAILVIVLIDTLVLGAIGWVILLSAAEVREALPAYAARFAELDASLVALLQGWGVEVNAVPYAELLQPERIVAIVSSLLVGLTGLVSASVLVLLYLVFMLGEATALPAKLHAAVGDRADRIAGLGPIVHEVQQYLAVKTAISLATGVLIGVSAALVGVDFALFWGLLAFLLNYIPNIGSIVAAVPAVSLALVQLGPGPAAALALAYLTVNLVIGNLIDPAVMGRRLGMSTLVVILSLAFWGWVWGVVGMLLAVPLTMAVKIALENSAGLRWIAVLMGPAPTGAADAPRPHRSDAAASPPAAVLQETASGAA